MHTANRPEKDSTPYQTIPTYFFLLSEYVALLEVAIPQLTCAFSRKKLQDRHDFLKSLTTENLQQPRLKEKILRELEQTNEPIPLPS